MAKIKVAVVGCGWLGTAFGHAAKSVFKDIEVVGHDKEQTAQRRAEQLKAVDKANWNLPSTCEDARMIFMALPQSEIEPTLRAIAPYVAPEALIAGVCPVMAPILSGVAKQLPANVSYVACDVIFNPTRVANDLPIDKLTPAVFQGAAWVITPRSGTATEAVSAVASMAMSLEASPIFMDAIEHDGLRLSVDALPSAVAAAMINTVTSDEAWRERQWLAGTAFGAATVSADSTDAGNVAGAMIGQRDASVYWLNQVMLTLMNMRDAVSAGDAEALAAAINAARERRIDWLNSWHQGRPTGREQQEVPKQNYASIFLGERLSKQLGSGPKAPKK